jgi:hypothetical protein
MECDKPAEVKESGNKMPKASGMKMGGMKRMPKRPEGMRKGA